MPCIDKIQGFSSEPFDRPVQVHVTRFYNIGVKHDFLREGEYPSDPSASSGERVETVKKEEFQPSKTCQERWALNKGILLVAIGNYATAAVAFLIPI